MSKILGPKNTKVSEGRRTSSNYVFHYLYSLSDIIEETTYRIRLTGQTESIAKMKDTKTLVKGRENISVLVLEGGHY
jgi:hypothetical protein